MSTTVKFDRSMNNYAICGFLCGLESGCERNPLDFKAEQRRQRWLVPLASTKLIFAEITIAYQPEQPRLVA
jgi:hypothetical protein